MASASPPADDLRGLGRTALFAGRASMGALGVAYLSLVVLIPLSAVAVEASGGGLSGIWEEISQPQAVAALKFTVIVSLLITLVNVVMGTVIAWVLVRDEFPGKRVVDSLIDLPFALPTIVAGLTLLALYGPRGPTPVDVAYTRFAVALALLFVTLPFVVRSVQPVLIALDLEAEEAAASLGAGKRTIFRRIILPALLPAILAGGGLGFARAVGEFGSLVLISGNLPFKTEVASVFIYGQIEAGNMEGAAAVSLLLLVISFLLLTGIAYASSRWTHDA